MSTRDGGRYSQYLLIPHHNTVAFEKSPHYGVIKIVNALPREFKDALNVTKVSNRTKRLIKDYLIDKAYYSIEQYLLEG